MALPPLGHVDRHDDWHANCISIVTMLNTRKKLRIAQVAPLYESVPPRLYGGTERVVSYLTEELVARGHDVTLFASGDSVSRARMIAPCEQALWLTECSDPLPYHFKMLEEVYRRRHEFDFVHFHVDFQHFRAAPDHRLNHATTLHGRLDIPGLDQQLVEFSEMPLVSISMQQRAPLANARWVANIAHGLPLDLHHVGQGGDYLAFVGRLCPEKRVDRAIEIAERAGMPLKIAAKIVPTEIAYFESVVKPLFARPQVEFLGELGEADKGKLLRNARALLFPIDWPEPFGLVMIEAMACGAPVVAFRSGSVPEVIDPGLTGFIVDSIDAAAAAVDCCSLLSRQAIRNRFEERFSAARMADDYVDLYHHLGCAQSPSTAPFQPARARANAADGNLATAGTVAARTMAQRGAVLSPAPRNYGRWYTTRRSPGDGHGR